MQRRGYTVRKRDLRLAASLALMAAAVVLLAWGFWPERRTVQLLRLDSQGAEDLAAAQPVHALRLEYPEKVRLHDRALVRLAFVVVPEDAVTQPSSEMAENATAEAVHPIAEARLEMPRAQVRPPDSVHEALVPDDPLEFYWTVVLSEPGDHRGTAWSFLTTQGNTSIPPTRVALGAQNVQMRSTALLGMGGEGARIVGCLSLIGGLVLGLPYVEPAARWVSRRGERRA